MELVENADIVYTGFVDETEKLQLLLQSTLLVMPSKFESLSMVLLEAMYYKKPVLVNQQCEVLYQHIADSNGGFSYSGANDFNDKLNTVLQNQQQSDEMGENGYQYVQQNYSWKTVLNKFNLMGTHGHGLLSKLCNETSASRFKFLQTTPTSAYLSMKIDTFHESTVEAIRGFVDGYSHRRHRR